MKYWRTGLLALGLLLILASFAAYGLRVSQTILPAGASAEEINQLKHQYGLEGPLALQYPAFSFLFLPGLIVLAVWGTVAIHKGDSVHTPLAKVFLILVLASEGITGFNYLLAAPPLDAGYPVDFWLNMLLIGLILASFAFALAIWRGFRWGVWAFGIAVVPIFVLSFVGGVPLSAACLGPLSLVILYVMVKPVWIYMQ